MHSHMRRGLILVPGLLGLVLLCHFGMTLAFLMPLNPTKVRIQHHVGAYMQPFFVQDWHLFAPDPVKDTRVLTVACQLRQPDGTYRVTDWADVSTPLRQARQRNRFSPADRLDRPQS